MKRVLSLAILLPISFLFIVPINQSVFADDKITLHAGADLTSRFIYRGLDLGSSPQVQPYLGVNYNSLNFYLWGSHPVSITPDGDEYKEVKFWMNYTIDLGSVALRPQIENHFNANARFFDFDQQTTPHVFQTSIGIIGKGDITPDVLIGYAFWGPDTFEPTLYTEAGLGFTSGDLNMRGFVSGQYSEPGGFVDLGYEGNFVINQIGIHATRSIHLSENSSIPIRITIALNPQTEKAFTAFAINF